MNKLLNRLQVRLGMDRKHLLYYLLIALNSQWIYCFVSLKAVMYNPMLEALGITNTQYGVLMSVYGIVQFVGNFGLGWVQDRFSIKTVLATNTIVTGIVGLAIACITGMPFMAMVLCFAIYGLTMEALYWGSVLKSVRVLTSEKTQATAFGIFEFLRGSFSFIANTAAVVLFTALGSTVFGARVTMAFASVLCLISGVIIIFCIPEQLSEKAPAKVETTKIAFKGFIKALRLPVVWYTGLGVACLYGTTIAITTYFVPYLQAAYLIPASLVGVFGVINADGIRMLSCSVSGIISDTKFKSSAHLMRVGFFVIMIMYGMAIILPKSAGFVAPAMVLFLLIGICAFLVKGVFFAPIGEAGVAPEISAAGMSLASFIGYSPNFWAYPVFGKVLDSFSTVQAYQIIFVILAFFALIGVIVTSLNAREIMKYRNKTEKS